MLDIQPLTTGQIPLARRLSDAAGWNQLDQDWERLITLFPQTTLGGWHEGKLVGTSSLAHFDPPPGQAGRLGWVGVMLVDPACRGMGFGMAMFDASLRCAADRGIVDVGLDATDMGRPLYVKRGFVDRFGMNRWKCAVPPSPGVDSRVRPLGEADWEGVLKLDLGATGVQRGQLFKRLMGEEGAKAMVFEERGGIRGFAMLRAGRVANHIAPIVAEDVDVARALCDALLTAHGNAAFPLFIDVGENCPIERHLGERGFEVARRLIRMAKAADSCRLGYSDRTFAIAGLELC